MCVHMSNKKGKQSKPFTFCKKKRNSVPIWGIGNEKRQLEIQRKLRIVSDIDGVNCDVI